MLALVQRVACRSVLMDGRTMGRIGRGLLVLACAGRGETDAHRAGRALSARGACLALVAHYQGESIDMNPGDFSRAAAAGAVLRVVILRQWEAGAGDPAPMWNVWAFVADEDDPEMAVGHMLVGADEEMLWFERIDDAYRHVRGCGYAQGIRIEDQVVDIEEGDDG